jgi:sec-independent protein translocase protein TatA
MLESSAVSGVVLFGPVGPEILVIVGILVLLFGANRIPDLARAVGESLGAFKKGRQEVEEELQEVQEETKEVTSEAKDELNEAKTEVEEAVSEDTATTD